RREAQQLLADSERDREEVERTNSQLRDQQAELEMVNQQLQENAIELELQSQELQATAAQLEDSTEEADAARRVAESERKRAESILESMADAHFVLDAEFRFISVNGAMERGVGLSRDALLGHTIWELFPGTVGTPFEWNYRRIVRDRVEAHFIHDYSDGRLELVVDVGAYPTLDGGIAVFWRDVTERTRTEIALRASENQLRTLADAIPTLAWTARADGYIDWYNARWFEYTGTTAEQMTGWGWQSVHDSSALPEVMEKWQASIASGEPFEMTFPLRGADGLLRRFLTRVIPLRDGSERVVRWFGTNTDVEAERLAREAAEDANQAKTDFLATMSHELRTPLNAIAGYVELLEIGIHGPVTDEQRDALSRIQRSQRHLLGLINDVLNFAKLEAGRVEYHFADVSVREAVDTLEPLIAPQLNVKGLRFSREECGDGRVVRADPDKLQQVLVNLLSNAIKFTPAGGAIKMYCEDRGDLVCIGVRDTGIGIGSERLELVFAPFVQIDRRLNAPQDGTGLGLAISRDLARGMGGDLTAESTLGVGSTFALTLPRAKPAAVSTL
ncbi:MAG: PAS domain-containing protein, partial [Anaerolineae bacterium]|nr:PAS domain-containing protein [Gemmatimonadaceae bacterium]